MTPAHATELVTTMEDDPYAPPGESRKILVERAIRDDPLAGLYARNQIDSTQFRAGRRWQMFWERAVASSVIAMDPMKEPVDGRGASHSGMTDAQLDAFRQLADASTALGAAGRGLVVSVLAEGLTIKEIARQRGITAELKIKYLGSRFRECLETLAVHWGLSVGYR